MWIESHQGVKTHPKTKRLMRYLAIPLPAAIGHLHCFWWWALDHAQDGSLDKYDAYDIADAAAWDSSDAEMFLKGMIDAGFIDSDNGNLLIHDWMDYAGRLIDQRKHAAWQKRRHKELYNNKSLVLAIRDRDKDLCRYCGRLVNWRDRKSADGATYDYVDPFGPTELENVVVACRACNAGKNQRTPEEANYTLLSVEEIKNLQKSVDINSESGKIKYHSTYNRTYTVPIPKDKELKDIEQFEVLWKLYPNKKGRKDAEKKAIRLLKEISFAELQRVVSRYADEVKGKDAQYIKHGSTFFNSGYVDYLDENYMPLTKETRTGVPPSESVLGPREEPWM